MKLKQNWNIVSHKSKGYVLIPETMDEVIMIHAMEKLFPNKFKVRSNSRSCTKYEEFDEELIIIGTGEL